MRFSKVYTEHVLAENFEDSKRLFLEPLLAIHAAHLVMLRKTGILEANDARLLAAALDGITAELIEPVRYDGSFEDLFCHVEGLLADKCGESTAGRLHTARSRNDVDVTLYRLRWREEVLHVAAAALELREVLLAICRRERETVVPLHTHTQPAQPSTLSHYFLGLVEHLERDHRRLRDAYSAMNLCPLGSCAICGTGFPIDRHLTSRLLGFDGPTGNTYASVAGVDYLLEAIAALMVSLTTLGKLLHDLLLWSMWEFQFLRLGDGFVQPSSIMPQKRNPVALEHSRALASKALGQCAAVFQTVHNTPFGDIVDVEDDLQPLVFNAFRDSLRSFRVVAAALATATFDRRRLEARASCGWITMTELADTLVRREAVPFRRAHAVAARMIEIVESAGSPRGLAAALAQSTRDVLGVAIEYSEEALEEILSPRNFVTVRSHLGGPAPDTTGAAADQSERTLAADREWLEKTQARLKKYPADLKEELNRL